MLRTILRPEAQAWGKSMSQRTQWHVMRSHGGHVMDPRDPKRGIKDPKGFNTTRRFI